MNKENYSEQLKEAFTMYNSETIKLLLDSVLSQCKDTWTSQFKKFKDHNIKIIEISQNKFEIQDENLELKIHYINNETITLTKVFSEGSENKYKRYIDLEKDELVYSVHFVKSKDNDINKKMNTVTFIDINKFDKTFYRLTIPYRIINKIGIY